MSDGESDLRAAVACPHGAAEFGVGLCNGQSVHGDGAVVGDVNRSVWRDRAFDSLLGSSPNVHKDCVARAEAIVLRRGNVHVGFKRELFVVEDVSSENLACRVFFLHFLFLFFGQENFKLVIEVVLLHRSSLFHFPFGHLSLFLFLRLALFFAFRLFAFVAVGFSCAVSSLLPSGDVSCTGHFTGLFFLIVCANPTNLFDRDATFHECRDDFGAARSLLCLIFDELHDLFIGHGILCRDVQSCHEGNDEKKKESANVGHLFFLKRGLVEGVFHAASEVAF